MVERELVEIMEMIDDILSDASVPRNIKRALIEAKEKLSGEDELSVKVSAALYIIEPTSTDINVPPHARTKLWGLMSLLEAVKK